MKTRILILQSAAPDHPQWIAESMHSVKQWAALNRYDYKFAGDEIFLHVPDRFTSFSKVTQSDYGRLALMRCYLSVRGCFAYDVVYWIDSDFLVWNQRGFTLPLPRPGAAVCVREAFRHHCGATSILFNNSVIGLSDEEDALTLMSDSWDRLSSCIGEEGLTPMTVIGTNYFSSLTFPLRRIVAKTAGCFSAESIRLILGPWMAGRRHLFWLGMVNGTTMAGANLCSSRETEPGRMEELVNDLIRGEDFSVRPWKGFAPFYRLWLRARNLPDRVRCWLLSRWRKLRTTQSAKALPTLH